MSTQGLANGVGAGSPSGLAGSPSASSNTPNNKRNWQVKPSSLNKKARKNTPTKKTDPIFVKFYRILPQGGEDASHGYAVTMTGFGEVRMTEPLFTRFIPANANYMTIIDCVPRVCFHIRNGAQVYNEKGYPIKMLTFSCDSDTTRDALLQWFHDVLLPALMQLGTLEESNIPQLHPTDCYEEVPTWYSVIGDKDYTFVLQHLHGALSPWFRNSQYHLYSLFVDGQTPITFMLRFGLNATHLRALDAANLAHYNAERADETAAVNLDAELAAAVEVQVPAAANASPANSAENANQADAPRNPDDNNDDDDDVSEP